MITQEIIMIDGLELVETYSDLYYIQQVETGVEYIKAIDVPNKYTYIETARLLPEYDPELQHLFPEAEADAETEVEVEE